MMHRSVFALAAILALGSPSLAPDAFARGHGGGGHGGGGHGGGGHAGFHGGGFHGFRGGHIAAARIGRHAPRFAVRSHRVGGGHPAHFVRGHHRHFWHGRWWDYGIGPCWVWSDDYAEYVWVCY